MARWLLRLHRWISLGAALFLIVAGASGCILAFVPSNTIVQLHVRLFAGDTGEWIVDIATAAMLLIVPTGFCLWWRTNRLTVRSGRRFLRDLHDVTGFYAAAFVLLLSATGVCLAFETPIASVLHLQPWRPGALPRSTDRGHATLEQLLARADAALPGVKTTAVVMPQRPTSPLRVVKGWSSVYVDRYSGRVLRVDEFRKLPLAYRMHVIVRAMHTGEIGGIAGRVVVFLSSAAIVFLAITGTMLWWRHARPAGR